MVVVSLACREGKSILMGYLCVCGWIVREVDKVAGEYKSCGVARDIYSDDCAICVCCAGD